MIHNKFRYLMTLVALFAMTAGAWAQVVMVGSMCNEQWVQCQSPLTMSYFDVKMADGAMKNDGFTPTAEQLVYTLKTAKMNFIVFGEGGKVSTIELLDTDGKQVKEMTFNKELDWEDQTVIDPWQSDFMNDLAVGYTFRIHFSEFSIAPTANANEWEFDMPAGNVEVGVEYYPGMLTFGSAIEGGKLEIVGMTDDALPEGFEKDAEGNIYVESGKQFKVKAVPAEGFHLVSLTDGTNDIEVDADGIATITMPDEYADLTLTATFSDKYTVTLNAEGLSEAEAAAWKAATGDNDPAALPLENVKYGTEVKVTYSGTKKVIGVKAEKKAAPKLLEFEPMGVKFYYYEGETWGEAIRNHPENAANGWSIDEEDNNVKNNGRVLHENDHDDEIKPDMPVSPNLGYIW